MQTLHIIATPPAEFDSSTDKIFFVSNKNLPNALSIGDTNELPFRMERIKILKSLEEMKRKKKEYRRLYSQKPHVKAKQKARMLKPETIEKRKLYAKKPEVQLRKREISAIKRRITNALKEKDPTLYSEIFNQLHKDNHSLTQEKNETLVVDQISSNSQLLRNPLYQIMSGMKTKRDSEKENGSNSTNTNAERVRKPKLTRTKRQKIQA